MINKEVMSSQTIRKVARYAEMSPRDLNDTEVLKSVLSTSVIDLAVAMDNRRIRFDRPEDEAAFLGLLTCSVQQIFDGGEVVVSALVVE